VLIFFLFLKRSKIDISEKVRISFRLHWTAQSSDRDRGLKKRLRRRHLANWQCSYRERPNELATKL